MNEPGESLAIFISAGKIIIQVIAGLKKKV